MNDLNLAIVHATGCLVRIVGTSPHADMPEYLMEAVYPHTVSTWNWTILASLLVSHDTFIDQDRILVARMFASAARLCVGESPFEGAHVSSTASISIGDRMEIGRGKIVLCIHSDAPALAEVLPGLYDGLHGDWAALSPLLRLPQVIPPDTFSEYELNSTLNTIVANLMNVLEGIFSWKRCVIVICRSGHRH